MLRDLRPRRYLEVGSGFTTALAMDVNERFFDGDLTITAIEPYPALLHNLLRPGDRVEVVPQPVQRVPLSLFAELEANDILFIDSSHMVKTGSDVQFLVNVVLPVLAEGVYVHFHDMFWPFEYPRAWLDMGIAWNEDYLVHAFLLFNNNYEIVLWNDCLAHLHADAISEYLPAMLANTGGAVLAPADSPTSGCCCWRGCVTCPEQAQIQFALSRPSEVPSRPVRIVPCRLR